MRRDQPTTPFDVEADDLTHQFWGASKDWPTTEHPAIARRSAASARGRDDTTGSLRVIREGFAAFRPQTAPNATGEIARHRRHGSTAHTVGTAATERSFTRREATLGELGAGRSEAGGWLDDDRDGLDGVYDAEHDWDGDRAFDDVAVVPAPRSAAGRTSVRPPRHDVPLSAVQPLAARLGLGAVDPLLLRAGALLTAIVLLVPVMLSLRPDRSDPLSGDVVGAAQQMVAGVTPVAAGVQQAVPETIAAVTATVTPDEATPGSEPSGTGDAAIESGRSSTETAAGTSDPGTAAATGESDARAVAVGSEAAVVDVAAERIAPPCPQTYTAAPGDSWYRIAAAAGITPSALLAENGATTDTVILPGDEICLPAGADVPAPPTTPTTTAPGADQGGSSSTTTSPSTTSPSTTTAPTTTAVPVAQLSRTEVQDLIRSTWPADEVDKALAVARRESNFIATADNGWCCVGVFQIYWSVHRGWLDDFGVYERSDLYDARKNVAAAYHIWQNQGWGPWGG